MVEEILSCCWDEAGNDEEKAGCLCSAGKESKIYPKMDKCCALILCCINICPITSGWGTMLSACCCCGNVERPGKIFCIGLMQFLLTFILIGWVWSVWHGCKLYEANNGKTEEEEGSETKRDEEQD